VFTRKILRLREPNKGTFIALNRQQIALHLGLALLPRFMRQRGLVIGFGVDQSI
jgi:hypothetical protein